MQSIKTCSKCKQVKEISLFDHAKLGKFKKKAVCKECCRLLQIEYRKKTNYDNIWRNKNRDKTRLAGRKFFWKHRNQELLRSKEKYERMKKLNPEKLRERDRKFYKTPKGRVNYYKKNARLRDLEFNLSLQECEQLFNSPCNYCGDSGKVGIDRKDNTKGYFKGNVVSCCKKCNFMKRTQTEKEFIDHCKKIVIFNEVEAE